MTRDQIEALRLRGRDYATRYGHGWNDALNAVLALDPPEPVEAAAAAFRETLSRAGAHYDPDENRTVVSGTPDEVATRMSRVASRAK